MNDIYKTPESELSTEPEKKEVIFDISGIKRYRWLMLFSLAVWYMSGKLIMLGLPGHQELALAVQGFGIIVNIISFAILASKIYQRVWVTLLCLVLSLVPLVNIIACIFMN